MVGTSALSLPSAPGAPLGQSGMEAGFSPCAAPARKLAARITPTARITDRKIAQRREAAKRGDTGSEVDALAVGRTFRACTLPCSQAKALLTLPYDFARANSGSLGLPAPGTPARAARKHRPAPACPASGGGAGRCSRNREASFAR